MLPLHQAAEHGLPKGGVLGLCKPPNPTLLSPSLLLHTTWMGRPSSPHTTASLTCNKTSGGRGMGKKVKFLDNFLRFFGLMFNVNFQFLHRRANL